MPQRSEFCSVCQEKLKAWPDGAKWLTGASGERLFQKVLANREALRPENAVGLAQAPLYIGGNPGYLHAAGFAL